MPNTTTLDWPEALRAKAKRYSERSEAKPRNLSSPDGKERCLGRLGMTQGAADAVSLLAF